MKTSLVKIYDSLLENRFKSKYIKSKSVAELWDIAQEMLDDAENNGWNYIEGKFNNYI